MIAGGTVGIILGPPAGAWLALRIVGGSRAWWTALAVAVLWALGLFAFVYVRPFAGHPIDLGPIGLALPPLAAGAVGVIARLLVIRVGRDWSRMGATATQRDGQPSWATITLHLAAAGVAHPIGLFVGDQLDKLIFRGQPAWITGADPTIMWGSVAAALVFPPAAVALASWTLDLARPWRTGALFAVAWTLALVALVLTGLIAIPTDGYGAAETWYPALVVLPIALVPFASVTARVAARRFSPGG
ncbi:MAG: hypothetical protein H0W41_02810 [Chloroflexi bacterium]|nr:hypothetical protein [Chloroflexota bacterium]